MRRAADILIVAALGLLMALPAVLAPIEAGAAADMPMGHLIQWGAQ